MGSVGSDCRHAGRTSQVADTIEQHLDGLNQGSKKVLSGHSPESTKMNLTQCF